MRCMGKPTATISPLLHSSRWIPPSTAKNETMKLRCIEYLTTFCWKLVFSWDYRLKSVPETIVFMCVDPAGDWFLLQKWHAQTVLDNNLYEEICQKWFLLRYCQRLTSSDWFNKISKERNMPWRPETNSFCNKTRNDHSPTRCNVKSRKEARKEQRERRWNPFGWSKAGLGKRKIKCGQGGSEQIATPTAPPQEKSRTIRQCQTSRDAG